VFGDLEGSGREGDRFLVKTCCVTLVFQKIEKPGRNETGVWRMAGYCRFVPDQNVGITSPTKNQCGSSS
jgi:hypothetical protein